MNKKDMFEGFDMRPIEESIRKNMLLKREKDMVMLSWMRWRNEQTSIQKKIGRE
jgi:hypothetical protein